MKTASVYKNLWDGDKQFLSAIAKEVATLADASNNMDHFQKQLTDFSDKWKAYKTANEADRKRKWQPSMGRPKNPLGTIWPLIYGSGWRDGVEKFLPEKSGIFSTRFFPCRDIKGVLGAYALLAVIHDKVLPQCDPIAKDVLPKVLSQEIWRNLVTGIDIEGQTLSGGVGVSQRHRSVIRRHKIVGFLTDVRADIGQDAPPLSEIEKLFFNKYSPTHRKLWEAEKEKEKQRVENVQTGSTTVPKAPTKPNGDDNAGETDHAGKPAKTRQENGIENKDFLFETAQKVNALVKNEAVMKRFREQIKAFYDDFQEWDRKYNQYLKEIEIHDNEPKADHEKRTSQIPEPWQGPLDLLKISDHHTDPHILHLTEHMFPKKRDERTFTSEEILRADYVFLAVIHDNVMLQSELDIS